MKRIISSAVSFMLCLPFALHAQFSKEDCKTAKNMLSGTLYLRLDVPTRTVVGVWGIGPESVLEVSPSGHDFSRKLALPSKHTKMGNDVGISWEFFPNDGVRYSKPSCAGDTVVVWMQGLTPGENEIVLDFIQIKTLDDFTKAFNQTFSKVPLQDEHPEWAADVRNAIASHNLIVGMTKDQAFDVVGTPINVVAGQEGGIKVETWSLRQDRGIIPSDHGEKHSHNIPAILKFVDGKLQEIVQTSKPLAETAETLARKVDRAGNIWLDNHKLDASSIDINGQWYQHSWGIVELHQGASNGEIIGKAPSYEIVGIVSGKTICLIFTSKGQTQYSAIMNLGVDGHLTGKYIWGLVKDEAKERSIDLERR